MELKVKREGMAIASHQNVVLCFYAVVPDEEYFHQLRTVEDATLRAFPAGISIFNLLSRPGKMLGMASGARNAAMTLGKDMAPKTLAIANVVLGEGFFAATARSIIASVAALTDNPFPQKIFAELPPALPWFVEQHDARSAVKLGASFAGVVEEFRVAAGAGSSGA